MANTHKLIILTDEQVNKLVGETEKRIINRYREHKEIINLDNYQHIINEIKNVNNIHDIEYFKKQLFYHSCSSNFWEGVIPLIQAYEYRLGY